MGNEYRDHPLVIDFFKSLKEQFDDVFIAQMVKNLREKYDKTKRIDVELENYFNETPPEKVKEDWEKLEEFDSTENSK